MSITINGRVLTHTVFFAYNPITEIGSPIFETREEAEAYLEEHHDNFGDDGEIVEAIE